MHREEYLNLGVTVYVFNEFSVLVYFFTEEFSTERSLYKIQKSHALSCITCLLSFSYCRALGTCKITIIRMRMPRRARSHTKVMHSRTLSSFNLLINGEMHR